LEIFGAKSMVNQIRTLLVDDEKLFIDSLTKVLTRRGINVQTAPDGYKAIELLTNEEFDVIVLDMRMPGMDGLTTLKAIRERDALIPVILLTGNIDVKQVSEALKEGAAEVLLKPCPVETLVSCIEDAYERKGFATNLAGTS
jgi:DNA-binding NtrC family response regulator